MRRYELINIEVNQDDFIAERREFINIEVNQDDFIAERRELINVEVNRDDFIAEFGEEFDFASSNSVDSGIFGCDQ